MALRLDLNNFNACPQYNDWLDEQYTEESGSLDILGFKPRPSVVLFSLSQDTYQAGFADFQAQRQEEIQQVVFEDFPSPIAHYFYRFENGYENELQRLHLLRDTWEAIVDILHAIAVAECRFRRMLLSDPVAFSHFLSSSIAQRLLNVERIINCADVQGVPLLVSQIAGAPMLATMRELNQSRNGFSHSATQSESQARTWIGECYEDVIDVLDSLRGLANTEILRYMGQIDGNTLRCETFKGHGFTRTIHNVTLSADQIRDSQRYFQQGQVLISAGESVFGLRPFIYYREEASGHATKLCMFRRTLGDAPRRQLEYEVVGDAVRWEQDRAVFKPDLDELRSLFGLGPDELSTDAL